MSTRRSRARKAALHRHGYMDTGPRYVINAESDDPMAVYRVSSEPPAQQPQPATSVQWRWKVGDQVQLMDGMITITRRRKTPDNDPGYSIIDTDGKPNMVTETSLVARLPLENEHG